jgi:hypothetical protein
MGQNDHHRKKVGRSKFQIQIANFSAESSRQGPDVFV